MNPYEGLNLPELMELMHGLSMPTPVSWMPTTQGWWILAAWLLAVFALGAWQLASIRRQNRYRREALAELSRIESRSDMGPQDAAAQIAVLLKRTALAAYPREQIAHVYGADWARFLRDSVNDDRRVAEVSERLARAAYRPDANGGELFAPARRWIRLHRA